MNLAEHSLQSVEARGGGAGDAMVLFPLLLPSFLDAHLAIRPFTRSLLPPCPRPSRSQSSFLPLEEKLGGLNSGPPPLTLTLQCSLGHSVLLFSSSLSSSLSGVHSLSQLHRSPGSLKAGLYVVKIQMNILVV